MSELSQRSPSHPAADPGARLADNIVLFARALRAAGLAVGPAAVLDAVQAVEAAGLSRRDDFYWALHAIFVTKRDQHLLFDQAFQLFWRPRGLVEKMLAMLSPVAPAAPRPHKPKPGESRIAKAMAEAHEKPRSVERQQVEVEARLTVSEREVLQAKDFAQMSAEEISAARAAISRLVLPVDQIPTRRMRAADHGRVIDARRTLRASLRSGGGIIPLRFRERRHIHPPVVALCDISGSMSQYTQVFLHFLHALTESRRRVHTFLFGTRLTNVTRQLLRKDPDEALAECSAHVVDWSGGTRIATALRTFNRLWSRRVLGQGAIVLLITDGLERESDEDLGHEMERLRKSCRRLIWLNPLLRFSGFEARTRGVRLMLPHVDEFRPIHNLDSIADLCAALSGAGEASADPRSWLNRAAPIAPVAPLVPEPPRARRSFFALPEADMLRR